MNCAPGASSGGALAAPPFMPGRSKEPRSKLGISKPRWPGPFGTPRRAMKSCAICCGVSGARGGGVSAPRLSGAALAVPPGGELMSCMARAWECAFALAWSACSSASARWMALVAAAGSPPLLNSLRVASRICENNFELSFMAIFLMCSALVGQADTAPTR